MFPNHRGKVLELYMTLNDAPPVDRAQIEALAAAAPTPHLSVAASNRRPTLGL